MATMQNIGRCPISKPGLLLDPYELEQDALIHPAEDFTISIKTISRELYTNYQNDYNAGRWDNDYFVLVSQLGIGDSEMPSIKVNYLDNINNIQNMDHAIQHLEAENIVVVEDYQKDAKNLQGLERQRIFLSFNSFCQGLGQSSFQDVTGALKSIVADVGAAFPSLIPFTSISSVVLDGINNILKKFLDVQFASEVKKEAFTLFPYEQTDELVIGEAPLQTGSYVFFFGGPVELDNLQIGANAIVTSTVGQPVTPYIVVNIKKGITLAPQQIDANLATEVLESYKRLSQFPLNDSKLTTEYSSALKELGSTLRLATSIERYYELKNRDATTLSEAEKKRIDILSQYLKDNKIPV